MPLRSNLAHRPRFRLCSICNEFVELETAKIDEIGNPVHEECYVSKVSLRSIRPPPEALDAKDDDNLVLQKIVTFLNSAEARAITNSCPVCESQIELRKCTFFYAEQTWEIQIPVCLYCDPFAEVPPHDA
jgi:hypothetical protein